MHSAPYMSNDPDDQYYYSYYSDGDKADVHAIVWSSFSIIAVPAFLFSQLEKNAYREYFGEEKTDESPLTEEHYTFQVESWEKIMQSFIIVWGPMFLLGLFSLSDLMMVPTALYIEHMLSNLYIPAFIYGFYHMFALLVDRGDKIDKWGLAGYLFVAFTLGGVQFSLGTEAMDHLNPNLPYRDYVLAPSIFYIFGWITHQTKNAGSYYYDY